MVCLGLVLGLGSILTLGSASASAEVVHNFLANFDGSATPAGSFGARGVAVDNSASASSGDIYVADSDNNVVDKFSATGAYLCQITGQPSATTTSPSECAVTNAASSPGTPQQGFTSSARPGPGSVVAVAVDPTTGAVWVLDGANEVVDEFSPTGVYESQFSVPDHLIEALAVDAATGDVYASDANFEIVDRFDPSTSSFTTFATGTPSGSFRSVDGLAVDNSGDASAGDVYVVDNSQGVSKFSPAGSFISTLTSTLGGSLAVDPGNGDIYGSAGGRVDQFDSSGTLLGHIDGTQTPAGSMGAAAIALVANGDVDVADGQNNVLDEFGPGVVIPDVTTTAPSSIGANSATLSGAVNADGTMVTDCHFVYVDAADYNPALPNPYAAGQTAPCAQTPSGSASTPVSAAVTGLAPGTTYHVQLFATNSNGTNSGGDTTFKTLPPPSVDSGAATDVTASSATLSGDINPNGYDTTYQFQWGPTTSYTASSPAAPADIGSGNSDVPVSTPIAELTANTEYHWRIVATNSNGTTYGPDHTFIYDTTGGGLPDDRAYEQVTPAHKNGALFPFVLGGGPGGLPADMSLDGSRVILSSVQCLSGAQSCTGVRGLVGTPVAFNRTPTGWQATPLGPSATVTGSAATALRLSADSGTALFSWSTPPAGEDDLYDRQPDGTFTDIGPAYPPATGPHGPVGNYGLAGTASLSELVFAQDLGNDYWPFDSTVRGAPTEYEYSGTGNTQPQLLGVNGGAGSTDLISSCGTVVGGNDLATINPMSTNGNTVYFTAIGADDYSCGSTEPAADTLYARLGGTQTVLISGRSPSGCTTSACQDSPPADVDFMGASGDGSKAFFLSTQQLTDAASEDPNSGDTARNLGCGRTTGANGCNLYLYDFDKPSGQNLIDVSAGDTSGLGPEVQGVMSVSPDGSHVYFVAKGLLTATANQQGQLAQAGADNLYAYERDATFPDGHLAFIAVLPAADQAEWDQGGTAPGAANVSPDGRYLVFTSSGDLTDDDSSTLAQQVFRYDANTGTLNRISIGNNGFGDNGNAAGTGCAQGSCPQDATIVQAGYFIGQLGAPRTDPTMADNGSRVFFESPQALAPHALGDVQITTDSFGNPEFAQNVYEWEQSGVGSCPASQSAGCVYLISDGRDTGVYQGTSYSDVELMGSDSTGDNVFFSTSDQLVPQDTDTELDWYDARVGGGFPSGSSAPPCSGDNCQGQVSAPPLVPTVGTVTYTGPGNASTGAFAVKVRLIRRTVRGDAFKVIVRVPAAGHITISGGKVRTTTRHAATARSYTLTVKLTGTARRQLKRRRHLGVKVNVRYRPNSGKPASAAMAIELKARASR